MMVQIPDVLRPGGRRPASSPAPSSGSRGVYGAIGTSGEWGLKNGCAVAYTDKGTGIGAHDLQDDTVTTLRGVREPSPTAGRESNFTAPVSAAQLRATSTRPPDRWAWKHAHSRANPEADWDDDVLQSIELRVLGAERAAGGASGSAPATRW